MTLTTHEVGLEALDALSGVDSLCLFIAEDERPLQGLAGYVDWRLCGGLSRLLVQKFFVGAQEDTLLMPTDGRLPMGRLFVVGVGKAATFTPASLGSALSSAARMLSRARVEAVALELPGQPTLDEAARAEGLTSRFLPEFKGARVAVLAERGLRQRLGTPAKAAG